MSGTCASHLAGTVLLVRLDRRLLVAVLVEHRDVLLPVQPEAVAELDEKKRRNAIISEIKPASGLSDFARP